MFVIVQSLRRRRADILHVGESTLDIGELTVGETTRRRNDRNSHGVQKKLSVNDNKTKRYGNSNFLLDVF